MMYDVLAERIEQIYPDLMQEVETDDLPLGKAKHYSLGSFIEVREEDRPNGEWNQYYIWMRIDHTDAKDEDKLSIALAHEYGHFLCRTLLYPKLGKLGQYISYNIQSRKPYKNPEDFASNLITLIEEAMAWILGWGMLFRLGGLKKFHLRYGFKCWKSYWYRMKRLCSKK